MKKAVQPSLAKKIAESREARRKLPKGKKRAKLYAAEQELKAELAAIKDRNEPRRIL